METTSSAVFQFILLLENSAELSALHFCFFVRDYYRCWFLLTSLTSLEVFPLAFQKKDHQRGATSDFPVRNISKAQPEWDAAQQLFPGGTYRKGLWEQKLREKFTYKAIPTGDCVHRQSKDRD